MGIKLSTFFAELLLSFPRSVLQDFIGLSQLTSQQMSYIQKVLLLFALLVVVLPSYFGVAADFSGTSMNSASLIPAITSLNASYSVNNTVIMTTRTVIVTASPILTTQTVSETLSSTLGTGLCWYGQEDVVTPCTALAQATSTSTPKTSAGYRNQPFNGLVILERFIVAFVFDYLKAWFVIFWVIGVNVFFNFKAGSEFYLTENHLLVMLTGLLGLLVLHIYILLVNLARSRYSTGQGAMRQKTRSTWKPSKFSINLYIKKDDADSWDDETLIDTDRIKSAH
ncbi:hypothetical protein B7494_g7514 [Chlorociboria aeruginascens]|nr:hypothetical protein B7494_g7514 [Chlorociboria aeruginascens]